MARIVARMISLAGAAAFAVPVLAAVSLAQDSTARPGNGSAVPLPTAPPAADIFSPEAARRNVDTVDRVVAVVGKAAITWSDLLATVNEQRAQGRPIPHDSAAQVALGREVLNALIDQEVLVQKALELDVEVTDAEVSAQVDQRIRAIRQSYPSEEAYRAALQEAGMGTPEEFRQYNFDQFRRYALQQRVMMELRKSYKLGSVTDEEVDAVYEENKNDLQRLPATVSFRQIIITPTPSPAEDSAAKAKAQSILDELKKGADFAQMARRESMDPGSKDQGGDLGWHRRGSGFAIEFEKAMFSQRPGEIGPLVKTSFGYHIIRVDRVQPAEVKASHILIAPSINADDITKARVLADSVAQAWRNGANFDTLVAKVHDPIEAKGFLNPIPLDSLPPAYKSGFAGARANEITAPFELRVGGNVKFAIAQIVARTAEGEYSLADVRENLRYQLAQAKQFRMIIDDLRERLYVSIRY